MGCTRLHTISPTTYLSAFLLHLLTVLALSCRLPGSLFSFAAHTCLCVFGLFTAPAFFFLGSFIYWFGHSLRDSHFHLFSFHRHCGLQFAAISLHTHYRTAPAFFFISFFSTITFTRFHCTFHDHASHFLPLGYYRIRSRGILDLFFT